MPAPSLRQLAKSACIKNIRCTSLYSLLHVDCLKLPLAITDVGDVPYELIRPVLIKLENPEQLVCLEQFGLAAGY